MRNLWLGWFVLTASPLGFAQHSVTIAASRSTPLQADQAVFAVSVNSGVTAGLDDIVAALQGSGITASDLSSVYTQAVYVGSQTQQVLQWTFTLPVSLSQLKDTLLALVNLQNKIGQKGNALTMTFFLQGTQVSPPVLQSQQCPIPDLLADARAQAQTLAAAAGFFLGPVIAMSTGGPAGIATGVPTFAYLTGDFSAVSGGIATFPVSRFVLPISPANGLNSCSLVVEFRLN